jgi:hypothetical protein
MSTYHEPDQTPHVLNRRHALVSLGVVGLATLSSRSASAQQAGATPAASDDSEIGRSSMPDWQFSAVSLSDPYTGTMTKPTGLPAEARVVSLQVILTNASDQPLEFSVTDVRLRDANGSEYRAGEYLGTEPRLVSQNLPSGERTRGWVWFGVPDNVDLASIVFSAPPPLLSLSLEGATGS